MNRHSASSSAARLGAWLVTLVIATSVAFGTEYAVGPGQPYANINDVPWESLMAGDTVLIHWRAEPYFEKWVICRQGTEEAPITVRGVPGPNGELPIIDGNGASTRLALDYWNENRGLIKVGGASIPPDTMPRYIVIESLELRSARPPYAFTDDAGGTQSYVNNAAAVYVEKVEHLTIRNCVTHDCGNGIFIGSSDEEPSRDILIEGNYIHSNGNVGSAFEHNTYTAAIDITYQFNRFGPLRAGTSGNNLKDRSAGLVVRYNWIEGGNRQLDLVDAEDSVQIRNDPAYPTTHVYGNVLIELDADGNSQIVHYGGDSGSTDDYRKGTLYFYHNTVVSQRVGNTTLFRLSTDDEHCDARNNIFYVTASGNKLALVDSDGVLDLSHNWFKPGYVNSHGFFSGVINDDGTGVIGSAPGFVDEPADDYHLAGDSACLDAAGELDPAVLPEHEPAMQYLEHQAGEARCTVGAAADIGAFERTGDCCDGDVDGDGDVDLTDYAGMPGCLTGPADVLLDPCCLLWDLDEDADVDLADYSALANGFTGS